MHHQQRLNFDDNIFNIKTNQRLINLDKEKINKPDIALTSEFSKKLKLNPNAKPIHFTSKLNTDSSYSMYFMILKIIIVK